MRFATATPPRSRHTLPRSWTLVRNLPTFKSSAWLVQSLNVGPAITGALWRAKGSFMDGLGQLEVEGFSEIQQRLLFKRHYLSRAAISHACAWRGHRGEDRDSARAFATEKMCRREFAAHGRVWSPLLVGACAAHLEFLSGVLVRWTPLLQRSEVAIGCSLSRTRGLLFAATGRASCARRIPRPTVDTVRKSRYSDNQIYEENEHNRHEGFAQFCGLR